MKRDWNQKSVKLFRLKETLREELSLFYGWHSAGLKDIFATQTQQHRSFETKTLKVTIPQTWLQPLSQQLFGFETGYQWLQLLQQIWKGSRERNGALSKTNWQHHHLISKILMSAQAQSTMGFATHLLQDSSNSLKRVHRCKMKILQLYKQILCSDTWYTTRIHWVYTGGMHWVYIGST